MESEFPLKMSSTYVYEGKEYILTGRMAEKDEEKIERPRRRSKRPLPDIINKKEIMVEIEPAPQRNNFSPVGLPKENKWVRVGDLYAVFDYLVDEE